MDDLEAEQSRRAAQLTGEEFGVERSSFYLGTMDLVDIAVVVALAIAAGGLLVAVAESVVARRRAYASLVASGVPRGVLSRSILWQALAPAVPAIAVGLGVGVTLARGIMGDSVQSSGLRAEVCEAGAEICADPEKAAPYLRSIEVPPLTREIPIPFEHLLGYGALALAAILLTVGAGLVFLRVSTSVEELRVG
jgi:predicted lysophospholipase L1 biosynthesis ABC-type transport system permease subunit